MKKFLLVLCLTVYAAVAHAESNAVIYSSFLTGTESIPAYKELTDYISKRLGTQLTASYSFQSSQSTKAVALKEALLGFIGTGAYVTSKARYGLEPIATINPVKGRSYQSVIIVPADSKASALTDLKGRNFAFTELESYCGRLYVIYSLKKKGLDPKTFFSKVIFSGSHENSIKAVAEKTVDGAAVNSFIIDHFAQKKPDILKKIRIVESSEKVGLPLLVTSKFSDKKTINKIRDILFTMHKNPAGIAILRKLGINNFLIPNSDDYKTVENQLKIIQEFIP